MHKLSFSHRACSRYGDMNIVRDVHTIGVESSLYNTNRQLNALLKSGQIDNARYLFDKMPTRDEYTWNTMIAGYANSGRLTEARQLFDKTPQRNSITWTSLISGYCRSGFEIESLQLFWQMKCEGQRPSQFTLGSILRMCSINKSLSRGEQFHGYAIKTQFDSNDFVATGLVDMYSKCVRISEAEHLFELMSEGKNHVTWSAMITGYAQNGDPFKAIQCFREMRREGIDPNQYTFPSVFTACASISDPKSGSQAHGCIVRGGFGSNIFVQSSLVDMYSKCGDLISARKALNTMEVEDEVSWNSMIIGYFKQGFQEEALILFKKMHSKNLKIDHFTLPSVLNSFASLKDAKNAKFVHCLIIKTGFGYYNLVSNALVDMYAKLGDLVCSYEVFNLIKDKDLISWTSLITGYAHNSSHEEALWFFYEMRISGIDPDEIVIASVLSSCAELAIMNFGQQIHGNFIKFCIESSLSVDNSLLTMYAKCGCLEDANRIFESMKFRNVITWTALIIGYAQNGKGKDSLKFYNEMVCSGTKPDFITFIGLLFACSHSGLVEQGLEYFESMQKVYNIKPGPDHYACIIDLLGRAGKMREAKRILSEMTVMPDATVWKALLSACRVHGDFELAEKAAKTLFELDPKDPAPYVMLSNVYSVAGKWEEAEKIRGLMKSRGVNKEPGYSWVEFNGEIRTFMSEDRTQPDEVYIKVDEVMVRIRAAGYVPDMSFALRDVNEEGKEMGLAYHGEKLAVAFGLLFMPAGAPIRIYKNLRVCGDCHNAMKYVSEVYNRQIVLRDSNCFHHFKGGVCSCGDYW